MQRPGDDPRDDDDGEEAAERSPAGRARWLLRAVVALILVLAALTLWLTNAWLAERFTENTRQRAEMRAAIYSGNLVSELQRTSIVPLLLARDPELIEALENQSFATTSARLITAKTEIDASAILLIDASGRTVGATERTLLGTSFVNEAFFVDALRGRDTTFNVTRATGAGFSFSYSRAVVGEGGRSLGVIVVGSDFARLERGWAGITDAAAVTDSEGRIILATEPRWRGLTLPEALAVRSAPSAIARAFQVTTDWAASPADAYLSGRAVLQTETRIPFRGWRMTTFTSYDSVRQRVNAILAFEVMGFAILLAAAFYLLSRRAIDRTEQVMQESADLRALNARLTAEIGERERMARELRVAEQTVVQSSKLAALGEMSAGVSHELNQPLAAMRTYLAGARLLLQRGRPEEALSSFQRIDDLIVRMGAITRQLKSFARKGGDAFETFDLRDAISAALTLVEPQLRARKIRIARSIPRERIMIHCDRMRLEQVIINLLTNAIDATKEVANPLIGLAAGSGSHATLTVRDNGHGIADLEKLFEPFFTTKKPGEGTGLGLAISSDIVADFGGRLTAHNAEDGPGAVFEVQLPLADNRRVAFAAEGSRAPLRGTDAAAATPVAASTAAE